MQFKSRSFAAALGAGAVAALVAAGSAKAITDTVFKYSTAHTGYLTLHPMAFAPDGPNSADSYFIDWDAGSLQNSGNRACFSTGVNLPQAAAVTAVAGWFWTNTANNPGTKLFLLRNSVQGGISDKLVNGTIGNTGGRKGLNFTVSQDNKINNQTYLYALGVCLDQGHSFYGARITYTYTSAGD